MTQATYTGVLDLAAGAFLLAAVLVVWRRELRAMVRMLAWQGAALATIPLTVGVYQADAALIAVGVIVLLLRAVVLPLLLARAVGSEVHERRESTPLVNTTTSLLITAGLTVLAYAVTRPIIALDPSPATRAVPAAFAVILIAVFIMVSRRRALSQAVGFMMLDNGIAATAFLITSGVPLIVELGASLHVLFAVLVLGLLTGHMRRTFAAAVGWRRLSAFVTVLAALSVLMTAAVLGSQIGSGARFGVGHQLRADALTVTMLIIIGTVGTLATWASIGYINAELAHEHTDQRGANLYGVLVPIFLAAMSLAVLANNIGLMWVAIEATTVATAFLVGHRRTRAALEATWKYVVICSVGIALAFLGTVLLYFASLHAGASSGTALNIDVLLAHAGQLDPNVTHLAAGLLLLGYGAKAGLVPFHTWLADAHSQSPAPVSALMSGVLLSVAFSALLRVKSVVDLALGTGFLRAGLLIIGLLTLLIAASLLVVQTDFKRMLAYSSMENMGLVAVAAAAGTKLAITALLLHVLAHGIGKTLVFLGSGQLQAAHDSTRISDVTGVLARSRTG